jgi:hypothetical protein
MLLVGPSHLTAQATDPPALILESKIGLGKVSGRIDHMAFDPTRNRLFVAELGNNTVGVVDINERKVAHRMTGLSEPQGIGYETSTDTVYVAKGASISAGMPTMCESIRPGTASWLDMGAARSRPSIRQAETRLPSSHYRLIPRVFKLAARPARYSSTFRIRGPSFCSMAQPDKRKRRGRQGTLPAIFRWHWTKRRSASWLPSATRRDSRRFPSATERMSGMSSCAGIPMTSSWMPSDIDFMQVADRALWTLSMQRMADIDAWRASRRLQVRAHRTLCPRSIVCWSLSVRPRPSPPLSGYSDRSHKQVTPVNRYAAPSSLSLPDFSLDSRVPASF